MSTDNALCIRCSKPEGEHEQIDTDAALVFGVCPRYEAPAPAGVQRRTALLGRLR